MTNKLKQARKILLSFGFETKGGYGNERYVNGSGWYNRDNWSYNSTMGQFQMVIHHDGEHCTYTENLPALSNNQAKLSKLVKDLKRLKKLWFDTMDESFKEKFIKATKAEEALKDDFT